MTNCNSYDNRESCVTTVPSSCVPYTGYLSAQLFPEGACKPNVNDILRKLQDIVDTIQSSLGDNKQLDKGCLTFDATTASQKTINQQLITQLCAAKLAITVLQAQTINPDNILIAIDLLCLLDPQCEPATTYTLTDIITKLVVNYCNLLERVIAIETALNM